MKSACVAALCLLLSQLSISVALPQTSEPTLADRTNYPISIDTARPSLPPEHRSYRYRLEAGGFENNVSNGFGNWWGGELNLSSRFSERFTLSGHFLTQHRPGDAEQIAMLSALVQWSPSLYSTIALGGGGREDPSAFFPRLRYDATLNWKIPRISGLILNGGLSRLYYGAPNGLQLHSVGAIYYWKQWVFQETVYFNNARPGNQKSKSLQGAVQYGREGSYWLGLTAGGGRQAWQTLAAAPQNIAFTSYNVSVFVRKWLAPSNGIVVSYDYAVKRAAYRIHGLAFKMFWDF